TYCGMASWDGLAAVDREEGSMKFTFTNLQKETVSLAIEPWAMAEEVPPDGQVIFEVADQPPPEIDFALVDGHPSLSVISSVVRFRAEGQDYEFTLDYDGPRGIWR